jgi:hypothetical protein
MATNNIVPATSHPAEVLEISPEALEVANCYLQLQNASKVADELGVEPQLVTQILARREVKAYIDQVFFDMGFNNRFTMRKAMDAILSKKFQEMDEAGVGSNKDILEILALSHKITMEQIDKEIQLEKLKDKSLKSQVNVQINDGGGGSNYANLLERIINTNA